MTGAPAVAVRIETLLGSIADTLLERCTAFCRLEDDAVSQAIADAQHARAEEAEWISHMVRNYPWRETLDAAAGLCPICGGDCSAANPPVTNCPMIAI